MTFNINNKAINIFTLVFSLIMMILSIGLFAGDTIPKQ